MQTQACETQRSEKQEEMCVRKQLKLLKVLLNGVRQDRITKGVRLLHWNNCFVFYWQLDIHRAFPGTKLVFLCINCGMGFL